MILFFQILCITTIGSLSRCCFLKKNMILSTQSTAVKKVHNLSMISIVKSYVLLIREMPAVNFTQLVLSLEFLDFTQIYVIMKNNLVINHKLCNDLEKCRLSYDQHFAFKYL